MRQMILEAYAIGDNITPSMTIKTIGRKNVTCLSVMGNVHEVKYTLDEFYYNFVR